jgi:hypothetical protein
MKPALLLKRGSTYSFPKMNLLGMNLDKLFDIFTYYYCVTVSEVREEHDIILLIELGPCSSDGNERIS